MPEKVKLTEAIVDGIEGRINWRGESNIHSVRITGPELQALVDAARDGMKAMQLARDNVDASPEAQAWALMSLLTEGK